MLTGTGVVRATDGAPLLHYVFYCIRRAELSGPLNNRFPRLLCTGKSTLYYDILRHTHSIIKTDCSWLCCSDTHCRHSRNTQDIQKVDCAFVQQLLCINVTTENCCKLHQHQRVDQWTLTNLSFPVLRLKYSAFLHQLCRGAG